MVLIMKNVYHHDIIRLLIKEDRQGLRVRNIARRIYNMHADLFDSSLRYDALYAQIAAYLWTQSRRPSSPFVRTAYGRYSIKSHIAVQLDLFWDAPEYVIHSTDTYKQNNSACDNHRQLTFEF